MRTRTRTILAGLVLAAALVGGVAWATIPGTDGTIQGCYTTSNGNLRVVVSAAECRNSETAISWNQKGPAGATGAQGPTGATGPAGASGAAGANGVPGAQGAKGEKGDPGAKGEPGAAGTNGLDGRNGVDGVPGTPGNTGSQGAPGAEGADGAPCLPADPACVGPAGPPGTNGTDGAAGPQGATGPRGPAGGVSGRVVVAESLTVGLGEYLFNVLCPAGTVVLGGGASSGAFAAGNVAITQSYPSLNRWYAYVSNRTSTQVAFTVYAICAQPA